MKQARVQERNSSEATQKEQKGAKKVGKKSWKPRGTFRQGGLDSQSEQYRNEKDENSEKVRAQSSGSL